MSVISSSISVNSDTTATTVVAKSDDITATGPVDADAVVAVTAAVSLKCGTPATLATQHEQQRCKARKSKQSCANCSKRTARLCRRCAVVYYCSVEC
jgi:hypothetical protein